MCNSKISYFLIKHNKTNNTGNDSDNPNFPVPASLETPKITNKLTDLSTTLSSTSNRDNFIQPVQDQKDSSNLETPDIRFNRQLMQDRKTQSDISVIIKEEM